MNSTMKVILGLTVAAAACAAVGIMLSPDKGRGFQSKIRRRTSDWLRNFSTLLTSGKELVDQIKAKTESEAIGSRAVAEKSEY